MAKKKRSRTSDFSLGKSTPVGGLPTKESINKTIAQATQQESEIPVEKERRIPFTTALTPVNRALLETAAHEGRGSVADVLNQALEHYFKETAPIANPEMQAIFTKIYQSKVK
jgi:hypothetical protein